MNKLEEIINYKFKNNKLLIEALSHPSNKGNCQSQNTINYERLEFLGDAVLGMVITEMLINLFPEESEGQLAKRRASLVCKETLAQLARSLSLGEYITMTNSEVSGGGRDNSSNLENSLEALIAAIYLDGGFEAVCLFIKENFYNICKDMVKVPTDPKSALQEWVQKKGKPIPEYKLIKSEGPAHNLLFTVSVKIDGFEEVTAIGKSKKLAERSAASILLQNIEKNI